MREQKMNEPLVTLAVKATPPLTVSLMSLAGMPLQEWVYLVTIGYVVLQSIILVTKFIFWTLGDKSHD